MTSLAFATAADSRAQDNVLNPGYIAGELTLGAEQVTSISVNAYSNEGLQVDDHWKHRGHVRGGGRWATPSP